MCTSTNCTRRIKLDVCNQMCLLDRTSALFEGGLQHVY